MWIALFESSIIRYLKAATNSVSNSARQRARDGQTGLATGSTFHVDNGVDADSHNNTRNNQQVVVLKTLHCTACHM
jgi:hypothetical protein